MPQKKSETKPKTKIWAATIVPILICSLASLFYLYDFVLRVIPSVMSAELMAQYDVTAFGFGFLSSFFFWGYTLMQVPCGLLYDRYGPRRLLTITTLIAAISAFLFVATNSFAIASLARFFMGIGSAFAYIGALVLAMRWLSQKYYAMTAGIIQLMGAVGAIIGQAPLAYWLAHATAFSVMAYISLVGVVLAILFWVFIRDYPPGKKAAIKKHLQVKVMVRLLKVVQKPQNWATALYGFAIWAPVSVFAALWDVPFLQVQEHLSATSAAKIASGIWIGIAVGGPLLGWVSAHLHSRRLPLLFSSLLGVIVSCLILYQPDLPRYMIEILLVLFGIAASSQAVTFGIVQDNNKPKHGGTAAGFNNMAIVLGGALFQPLVGLLLHWHMSAGVQHMPPVYTAGDYQFALTVLPICYALAFFSALFLIKETHCKQQFQS